VCWRAEAGNAEEAKSYYERAIALDPNYVDAYNNIAVVILEGEAAIVEEMNGLGMSAADNKKYDELKEKRLGLYQGSNSLSRKSIGIKKYKFRCCENFDEYLQRFRRKPISLRQ
jgi:tetratricopeptide (TPR) repeat protein